MYCDNCDSKTENENRYCSKCGVQLNTKNLSQGDGSINISGANDIKDSQLHIGDIYNSSTQDPDAYIDRDRVEPIKIRNNHIKDSYLKWSGLLGIVGSLASIFSLFLTNNYSTLIIFLIGCFSILFSTMYVVGSKLKKTRFIRLMGMNIESNSIGELYFTTIDGDCPKCDGLLKLRGLETSKDRYEYFVVCNRNKNHIWDFDPTVLSDI